MKAIESILEERGIGEKEFSRLRSRGRWIARLLWLWGKTWRLDMGNWESAYKNTALAEGPAIFTFWHQSMVVLAYSHRNDGIQILMSTSRDGLLLAEICKCLGNGAVYGSSSRGGRQALKDLGARVAEGRNVAFAVDGPRGPRGRVKMGAAALASISGRPLLPVAVSARPRRFLGSWDRTLLPLPGARVRLRVGEPILVSREGGREAVAEASALLETRIAALTEQLDREMGQSTLPPDPPEPSHE